MFWCVTRWLQCTSPVELAKVIGTHPNLAKLLQATHGAAVVYKSDKSRVDRATSNAPVVTLTRRSDGKSVRERSVPLLHCAAMGGMIRLRVLGRRYAGTA